MLQELTTALEGMQTSLGWREALISLALSVVFSLACYAMYQVFYGSRNIGAGVHRMFQLGGPAITVLFLGIQTSIPLSLGLLGALSFVRFRTPVKDPAEIGFLLLLIASSIGVSSGNFMLTSLLLGVVLLVLTIAWLVRDRTSLGARGSLMIALDKSDFDLLESDLSGFLKSRLRGVTLEGMSVVDGRVNLQYQYRRQPAFDWTKFAGALDQATAPATVEVFVG